MWEFEPVYQEDLILSPLLCLGPLTPAPLLPTPPRCSGLFLTVGVSRDQGQRDRQKEDTIGTLAVSARGPQVGKQDGALELGETLGTAPNTLLHNVSFQVVFLGPLS